MQQRFSENIFLIVLIFVLAATANDCVAGDWSSTATFLEPGKNTEEWRNYSVASPDNVFQARVINTELRIVREKDGSYVNQAPIEVETLAEILWAPNSKSFVLTESDGGWVGSWSVRLFLVDANGVTESSPFALLSRDYNEHYSKCAEEPNIAAVGWQKDSSMLKVIVESPCHSSCPDMCSFRGYGIEPGTLKVMERLTGPEVLMRWQTDLGPRLTEGR